MDDLRSAKGIKKIKIFDSRGRIYYSSDRDEVGHHVATTTAPVRAVMVIVPSLRTR